MPLPATHPPASPHREVRASAASGASGASGASAHRTGPRTHSPTGPHATPTAAKPPAAAAVAAAFVVTVTAAAAAPQRRRRVWHRRRRPPRVRALTLNVNHQNALVCIKMHLKRRSAAQQPISAAPHTRARCHTARHARRGALPCHLVGLDRGGSHRRASGTGSRVRLPRFPRSFRARGARAPSRGAARILPPAPTPSLAALA